MRRMLTDKLTKSIKEVVNAYNEGEFSAVTANPETTTETLTAIEINGTGYAVDSGTEVSGTNDGTNWTSLTVGEDTYAIPQGSSVDIDEETIIEDPVTGKLKTAVGGYKEETVVQLPDCELTGTYDYDEYDADKAQTLFDAFEVNTQYPCTVTFTDVQTDSTWTESTFTVSGYIQSSTKTDSKFGGDPALFFTYDGNDYGIEFYVEPGQNRIHVYGGNVGLYPESSGGTVEIGLGDVTVTIYHKIDSRYLDVTNYEAGLGIDITDGTISVLKTAEVWNPVTQYVSGNYFGYSLNYDAGQFQAGEFNRGILQTTFGGGYNRTHQIDKTTYTQVSGGTWDTWYESSDADSAEVLATYIKNYLINDRASDITADNTFDFTFWDNIYVKTGTGSSMPNFSANVSVANDGTTVTVTGKTDQQMSIDGFVFDFTTATITTNATKVYYNDWLGGNIFNSADNSYIYFNTNIPYAELYNPIDNKFLPAFDSVPTVAGTYTLQVTVDASGNPTFTWVSANV